MQSISNNSLKAVIYQYLSRLAIHHTLAMPVIVAVLLPQAGAQATNTLPPLSPESLLERVNQLRSAFTSFDVESQLVCYDYSNGIRNEQPVRAAQLKWRSMGERSLAEEVIDELKQPNVRTRKYAITDKWSKRLLAESVNSHTEGLIVEGPSLSSETDLNVARAIWNPTGDPWRIINNENSTVSLSPSGTTYVLKLTVPDDKAVVEIEIDPAMGYLPIRTEARDASGKIRNRCVCSDFREVFPGLWLPHAYAWDIPGAYEGRFTLTKAQVNTVLSDESLDFPFPEGTIVRDKILGVRYVVGMEADTLGPEHENNDKRNTKPKDKREILRTLTTAPASEEDMEKSLVVAERLAAEHSPQATTDRKNTWAWAVAGGLLAIIILAYGVRAATMKKELH